MTRALRIRFAALAAFAIAFAQIAAAAQPWPLDAGHRPAAVVAVAPHGAGASGHCAAQAHDGNAPRAPSANFCEVHCQDGAQPDALAVAIAAPVPQSWLPVAIAPTALERACGDASVDARAASPPARVLFARFQN